MAVKRRKVRYDLSKDDSEWEGCFLLVKTLTMSELKEFMAEVSGLDENSEEDVLSSIDRLSELIETRIVGGQVLDESGTKREYAEDDLETLLDVPLIQGLLGILKGGLA